jgi:predicted RNA-binding Zn-ribbon protein involved in translation (DUF1610 family)
MAAAHARGLHAARSGEIGRPEAHALHAWRRRGDLHICPECGSDLVYPTDWAPASERHWQVALRCPECEWNGGGRYSQDVVDRLDEELDRGTEAVLDDLNILVRANMEDQIDRFVAALNGDNILPEDF